MTFTQVFTSGLAAFIASLVEAVEALTIVLAVGVSAGWKPALKGTLYGLAILFLICGLLGPTIEIYVPIKYVRIFVGAYLLILGLSWYKKSVLRASGLKEKHNEDAIFNKEVDKLSKIEIKERETIGLSMAFRGVLLEGLEVALIVLSFGSQTHNFIPAGIGAISAASLIALLGVIIKKQMSRVPENFLKALVGIMLVSFGTFWSGEGIGIKWYFGDLFILILIAVNVFGYLGFSQILKALNQKRLTV
jgi:uncharacterized membrane protein